MSRWDKRIELIANLSIIVAAVLLAGVLVKTFVLPRPARAAEVPAGTKLAVADVDWSRSRQTLLLALSVDCRFCSESAPFYQRLIAETSARPDLQVVAVLPQQVSDSQQYLDTLKVPITQIRQVALSALPIPGTPTLILVDQKGLVTKSWIGKLPPDKESEVLSTLQ